MTRTRVNSSTPAIERVLIIDPISASDVRINSDGMLYVELHTLNGLLHSPLYYANEEKLIHVLARNHNSSVVMSAEDHLNGIRKYYIVTETMEGLKTTIELVDLWSLSQQTQQTHLPAHGLAQGSQVLSSDDHTPKKIKTTSTPANSAKNTDSKNASNENAITIEIDPSVSDVYIRGDELHKKSNAANRSRNVLCLQTESEETGSPVPVQLSKLENISDLIVVKCGSSYLIKNKTNSKKSIPITTAGAIYQMKYHNAEKKIKNLSSKIGTQKKPDIKIDSRIEIDSSITDIVIRDNFLQLKSDSKNAQYAQTAYRFCFAECAILKKNVFVDLDNLADYPSPKVIQNKSKYILFSQVNPKLSSEICTATAIKARRRQAQKKSGLQECAKKTDQPNATIDYSSLIKIDPDTNISIIDNYLRLNTKSNASRGISDFRMCYRDESLTKNKYVFVDLDTLDLEIYSNPRIVRRKKKYIIESDKNEIEICTVSAIRRANHKATNIEQTPPTSLEPSQNANIDPFNSLVETAPPGLMEAAPSAFDKSIQISNIDPFNLFIEAAPSAFGESIQNPNLSCNTNEQLTFLAPQEPSLFFNSHFTLFPSHVTQEIESAINQTTEEPSSHISNFDFFK